jgi:hypothetical protein
MRSFEKGVKGGLAIAVAAGAMVGFDAAKTGPAILNPEAKKNLTLEQTAAKIGKAALCHNNLPESDVEMVNPGIVIVRFLAQGRDRMYKVFAAIDANRPNNPKATEDVEVLEIAPHQQRMIKIISSHEDAKQWIAQRGRYIPTGDPYSQEDPTMVIGPIEDHPRAEEALARQARQETLAAEKILDKQIPNIGLPGC